jgi:hypothetical protein
MITRCLVASALAFSALSAPAYADDQTGTSHASSGDAGSMPQLSRGKFPHRKPGEQGSAQGLMFSGAVFGLGVTLGQILAGGGNSGSLVIPPISGQ